VFTFGRSFGEWLGILAALGIPHVLVTPRQWQRGLVRPSDGPDPKCRSLAVARRLFPDIDLHRKKDHHCADALLIAYWAKKGDAK
jgi:crossover junction endodeoxyribonuclease RuvC